MAHLVFGDKRRAVQRGNCHVPGENIVHAAVIARKQNGPLRNILTAFNRKLSAGKQEDRPEGNGIRKRLPELRRRLLRNQPKQQQQNTKRQRDNAHHADVCQNQHSAKHKKHHPFGTIENGYPPPPPIVPKKAEFVNEGEGGFGVVNGGGFCGVNDETQVAYGSILPAAK